MPIVEVCFASYANFASPSAIYKRIPIKDVVDEQPEGSKQTSSSWPPPITIYPLPTMHAVFSSHFQILHAVFLNLAPFCNNPMCDQEYVQEDEEVGEKYQPV
ncbi:hypothetical protein OIU78_020617 [Salix suchowensis]|nr:hypothetical protein OIU78_020617 [Salix suchowensis]